MNLLNFGIYTELNGEVIIKPKLYDVIFFVSKTKSKTNRIINNIFQKTHEQFLANNINSKVMIITDWTKDTNCKVSIGLGGVKPFSKRGWMIKKILLHQKTQGNRHIVVDGGYIYKRNKYWSVGWDNLNGRADFQNKNSDDTRIKKWNISLTPWKFNKSGYVLFCLQLPWDASVYYSGYIEYIEQTIDSLLKATNRDIVKREHPIINKGGFSKLSLTHKYKEIVAKSLKLKKIYKSSEKHIKKDFNKSWCVVSFNSNSTVEATILGIPSFVADKGSMTWDISSHNLDVENLKTPDRQQWLNNISYAQWHEKEIISGEPFKQLGLKKIIS